MRKIKIVQIHIDNKFLDSTFDKQLYENEIIVIGKKPKDKKDQFDDSVLHFNFSRKDFNSIIKICKSADVVILYNLEFPMSYIANRLPKEVVVLWRFFGMELYDKIPHHVFSKKTFQALGKPEKPDLLSRFRGALINFINFSRFQTTPENEFAKAAFERIDYFFGLSKTEYDYLKDFWPQLPPFLQFGYNSYLAQNISKNQKNNLIIIGNNRGAYNNHLDIIEGLKKIEERNKYKFLLLFNYGTQNTYTAAVEKNAAEVKEIEVLDKFVPLDEFEKIYSGAAALVINGYRQMAMYNIFEAIRRNTKIYLNEKNVILDWLVEEEFKVFTIKDFYNDLISGNITLSDREASLNQAQFVKFSNKYSRGKLYTELMELIEKRKYTSH